MAQVFKFLCLVIWIGIVHCLPTSRGKSDLVINRNFVTIKESRNGYSGFEPFKISDNFPFYDFQEQYYKSLSDLLRQMDEYIFSITRHTPDINLPFNYFSTSPLLTILSNPNTKLLPNNPKQNEIPQIATTRRPFYIIPHNIQPFSDNTQQNQIPGFVTTIRPFNTNLNNNFQSNNRPQNQTPKIFTTRRPLILTTTKSTGIIKTTPVENNTPYTEGTSTTQSEDTTTEQNVEDYDDTTRPIVLHDAKSNNFNKKLLRSGSRTLPEVEHGSVQAGSQ